MSIDNSISWERIKRALSPKTVAIVLVIVALVSTVFYVTVKNNESNEILIWFVTTDTEDRFSEDALRLVNEYGAQNGIDKIILSRRHPEDKYFDVIMSTSAYYSCDIFIMREDIAQKYAELGMFLPLSADIAEAEELLYVGDDAIGILIDEDYYLLINAQTDVDREIIYNIFDILINE